MDLKILWHSGYHDGPLDGLALYNGKKIYFCENTANHIYTENPFSEIENFKNYIPKQEFECIQQLVNSDVEYFEFSTKNCDVEYDGTTLSVIFQRRYDLFDVPKEILLKYEEQHKLFQEYVGFNCDHDPKIYKPFTGHTEKSKQYYDLGLGTQFKISEYKNSFKFIKNILYSEFQHWEK